MSDTLRLPPFELRENLPTSAAAAALLAGQCVYFIGAYGPLPLRIHVQWKNLDTDPRLEYGQLESEQGATVALEDVRSLHFLEATIAKAVQQAQAAFENNRPLPGWCREPHEANRLNVALPDGVGVQLDGE